LSENSRLKKLWLQNNTQKLAAAKLLLAQISQRVYTELQKNIQSLALDCAVMGSDKAPKQYVRHPGFSQSNYQAPKPAPNEKKSKVNSDFEPGQPIPQYSRQAFDRINAKILNTLQKSDSQTSQRTPESSAPPEVQLASESDKPQAEKLVTEDNQDSPLIANNVDSNNNSDNNGEYITKYQKC
jgi:hypothetical protein